MTTPDDIVQYAKTFKGMRWGHLGRAVGPKPVVDCVGLVYLVAKHFDLPCEDMDGYTRAPNPGVFLAHIRKYSDRARDNAIPVHGAIGIFNDSIMPYHTGIFSVSGGKTTVIHAEMWPKRRVHEEGFDTSLPPLSQRLTEIRLFKDVDYYGQ